MTVLTRRLRAACASGESGSVLAIALVILMIFGLTIGVTLQFATTSQRVASQVAAEGGATYAGGGALDGAINRLRTSLATGTEADGTSTCFTVPAGALDNTAAVSVTCTPRTGSGSTAGGPSVPAEAILTTSANANEGVSLSGSGTEQVRGPVSVNRQLLVPSGSTLSSKTTTLPAAAGSIKAGTCSVAGTADPTCVTQAGAADPAWAGPTAYPEVIKLGTVPCLTPVMRLKPGTYLNQAELQAVLACTNTVFWFEPGTYYFDFRDTIRELRVATGDVVVGGTPSGWTPGTTPAATVPYPTAAAPSASACDPEQPGVNFVFGGESRLRVSSGGKAQLCAQETSSTKQNIVMQSLAALTLPLPTVAPVAGKATAAYDFGSGANWSADSDGAVVDGTLATVSVNSGDPSQPLRIGPFPSDLVPAEATSIKVTVEVTSRLNGSLTSKVGLNDDGGTVLAPVTLRTCPAGGCLDTAVQLDVSPPVSGAAVTPTLVNNMYVDVLVTSSSPTFTTARVDGVTVHVDFSAPIRPTSGTGTAGTYTTASTSNTAVLRTSTSSTTVVALHGTVHVPLAVVDLAMTGVAYTVIDRGIVARHLRLAMTPANTGVYLIALPIAAPAPRKVMLVANSPGELARAEVTLHDPAGTGNGSVVDIASWFVS
jgi:hypothetical protein